MSIFGRWFGGGRPGPRGGPALEEIARRYAEAARARFPGVRATVELAATPAASRVVLAFPDGGRFDQFLGNVWQRCEAAPDTADAVFGEQFASIERTRGQWAGGDDGREAPVLPVIKTRAWHDVALAQLRQAGVPEGDEPLLVRPLAGDLVVGYVEDRPDGMGYLGAASARERGLDGDGLFAHALRNLEGRLPQLRIEGGDGRQAVRLDGNYDASMVLLFERWRERIDVAGVPVFAIAARDQLLVCGSGDVEAVVALQRMAGDIVERSPYGLTSRLFVFHRGALAPLMVARKDDDIAVVVLTTGERLDGGSG